MAAKTLIGAALNRTGGVDRVVGARVTGGYFDVFGVQPALGRVFGREEDAQGQKVVVLSHRLWTRQFGANRAVLGTTVGLNQQPHTVIGIMPASFDFTAQGEDLWIPMSFMPQERENAGSHFLVSTRGCATASRYRQPRHRCPWSSSGGCHSGRTNLRIGRSSCVR